MVAQERRIADLEEAIRKLTARLGLNSRNSSKPPSSDMAQGEPERRQAVVEPVRKRGGQPGHPGTTRKPFPDDQVDHFVKVLPERCDACARKLLGEAHLADCRQVADTAPSPAEVTEYQLYRMECRCGHATTAPLPEGVSPWCLGPRLWAILTTLTGRYRLSRREAQEALVALYGPKAEVALGTVCALEGRASQALEGSYQEAREALLREENVHLDETGWRLQKRKAWLWSAVTRSLGVFRVDRNRSRTAYHRLMGEGFAGAIHSDRWKVYDIHPDRKRQLCWAHLKRDFQALVDCGHEPAAAIGRAGLRAAAAVTTVHRRYREGRIAHGSLRPLLSSVRGRLERTLLRGCRCPAKEAAALSRDVLKRYTSLWTFTRRAGMEPTNNRAERALRKAVLWRKGSFGSDSEAGGRFAERMLTVAESLRLQGRSVVDFVEATVRADLTGSPHPSLLPVDSS